jgi:hypothetical protein
MKIECARLIRALGAGVFGIVHDQVLELKFMATLFNFSVECGPHYETAEAISTYFQEFGVDLVTGRRSLCTITTKQDSEGNYWVSLWPGSIRDSGILTPEDAVEMSQLGFEFYRRLIGAPQF